MLPFPGGIADISNGTVILSALLAIIYLFALMRPPSRRRTVVKTGSIVLLAVLAWLQAAPLLLILALLFCAAGDAFLAHDGDGAFLGGLSSFLIGHIVYIVFFGLIGGGLDALVGWRFGVAIVMALFAAAFVVMIWKHVPAKLRAPVAVYALAILGMGVSALTVGNELVALGAALFMASDAILAIGKFALPAGSPRAEPAAYAVWVLYYLAQATITLAIIASF